MRAVSPKRAKAGREYAKLRATFLAGPDGEGRPCEMCEERLATEVHHKKGRTGSLYLDVTWWAALDRDCHRFLTENPASAYAMGMSVRRVGEAS
jgi:hypothetical protein